MRSSRNFERQIDKLLAIIEKQNDRIIYLAGRTWGDPPAADPDTFNSLDGMIDHARYAFAPEQLPDDEGF